GRGVRNHRHLRVACDRPAGTRIDDVAHGAVADAVGARECGGRRAGAVFERELSGEITARMTKQHGPALSGRPSDCEEARFPEVEQGGGAAPTPKPGAEPIECQAFAESIEIDRATRVRQSDALAANAQASLTGVAQGLASGTIGWYRCASPQRAERPDGRIEGARQTP